MSIHQQPAPQADTTVTADIGRGAEQFRIEDWWDRVVGMSWMDSDGNPAALMYALRSGTARLPLDNEVLYGKDSDGFGHLIHASQVSE